MCLEWSDTKPASSFSQCVDDSLSVLGYTSVKPEQLHVAAIHSVLMEEHTCTCMFMSVPTEFKRSFTPDSMFIVTVLLHAHS